MNVYTARVRLQQDIVDPRGRGSAVMVHHAELPGDLAAEAWCAAVAENARDGTMGRRWLASRNGLPVHRVECFRRSLEDRSSYVQVAEATFALDELPSGPTIELPNNLGDVQTTVAPVAVDPTAAVLVLEEAFSGTTPIRRRCYVGPVAEVFIVGEWSLPVVGPELPAYLVLPGTDLDVPADLQNYQGWWGSAIMHGAAEYLRGMHERADAEGGRGVVLSWVRGDAAGAVQWRPSAVKAHLRSRGTGTTFGPAIQRA